MALAKMTFPDDYLENVEFLLNTCLFHLKGSDFLLWMTKKAASLNFSVYVESFIIDNPRETGLVQTPMDTT